MPPPNVFEPYAADSFTEEVGTILFNLATRKIYVQHVFERDEYILVKAWRHCGSSCQETAFRSVNDISGLPCRMLPLIMSTLAPRRRATNVVQGSSEAQFRGGICEPFYLRISRFRKGDINRNDNNVKLAWWYIAAVDEIVLALRAQQDTMVPQDVAGSQRRTGSAMECYSFTDVLEKLTFPMDRDTVTKAIAIVTTTFPALIAPAMTFPDPTLPQWHASEPTLHAPQPTLPQWRASDSTLLESNAPNFQAQGYGSTPNFQAQEYGSTPNFYAQVHGGNGGPAPNFQAQQYSSSPNSYAQVHGSNEGHVPNLQAPQEYGGDQGLAPTYQDPEYEPDGNFELDSEFLSDSL